MKSLYLISASVSALLFTNIAPLQGAPGQTQVGPAQITALSASSVDRSGYLEITGTIFGATGTTLIGGVTAPIADWQNTKIVAYVPEAAALGASTVQVTNDS